MQIRLVPIDQHNWEAAANLHVQDDQADFLTPNVYSIAESKFHDALQPMAIYDGPRMVGFLMYALDPADDQYWLYRFMIDHNAQRQGYGTAALKALIDHLKQLPGCNGINVGYHRTNLAAERLYLSLGFKKTGVASWGELTARLQWEPFTRD